MAATYSPSLALVANSWLPSASAPIISGIDYLVRNYLLSRISKDRFGILRTLKKSRRLRGKSSNTNRMNKNAKLVQLVKLFTDLIFNTTEKTIRKCTKNYISKVV